MNRLLTRDPKTPPSSQVSHALTVEQIRDLLDKGIKVIMKQELAAPLIGRKLFRTMTVEDDAGRFGSPGGFTGLVPLNRDGDTMPFLRSYSEFSWEWSTFQFRAAIAIERKTVELDRFGQVKKAQRDLLNAFKRTQEYVFADVFNRAFGTTGSLLLASDGCYLIDEDRPNPDPAAGTWSNLEATADLTDETLFQAVLNARSQVGPDGHLAPTEVRQIMIGPADEKKLWTLLTTERIVTSNYNDRSWSNSFFSWDKVIVNPYLETRAIFYILCDTQSEENELLYLERVKPEVLTEWGMPGLSDPDVLGQRLRAEWGIALGSPRRVIRGGLISTSTTGG